MKKPYGYDTLKTPQYENCEVLSPEGQLMFRCPKKKANWYLSKNLGIKISDTPLTIQLTFTPKGNGHIGDPYYLQPLMNQCVVCGSGEKLTKHHIVPYCYRKFFPLLLKDHRSYDVLPLCVMCHGLYEEYAMELKEALAIKYNAPPVCGVANHDKNIGYAIKAARTLYAYKDKIPLERQEFLLDKVRNYLKREPQPDDLEELQSKNPYEFRTFIQHGELVVNKITDVEKFVQEWRQHFLDKMKPKFMPDNWRVDRTVYQV